MAAASVPFIPAQDQAGEPGRSATGRDADVARLRSLEEPAEDPTAPPGPVPVVLRIPAIELDTSLQWLGLTAQGALEVPENFELAGWWSGGTRPGDEGPAVIAGHVDSYQGPAVFARLGELEPDDRVLVRRLDGSTVVFAVTGRQVVAKDAFPSGAVYGPVDGPELRLITCTGEFFDDAYRSNLIVFARRVGIILA